MVAAGATLQAPVNGVGRKLAENVLKDARLRVEGGVEGVARVVIANHHYCNTRLHIERVGVQGRRTGIPCSRAAASK